MPNNRTKTLGQIKRKGKASRGKGESRLSQNDINPTSRRAVQLNRIALRADKLATEKKMRQRVKSDKSDRISFFRWALLSLEEQEQVPRSEGVWDFSNEQSIKLKPLQSIGQIASIINDIYLPRFQEELAQLMQSRRPGRPKHSRQVELENLMEKEQKEFTEGFKTPDLTDPETAKRLIEEWGGDLQGIDRLKFVTIRRSDLV